MHRITLAVVLLGLPALAAAQDRTGAFVGGNVSLANMEAHSDAALAGSFGYRFTRLASLVLETTAVPKVRAPLTANTQVFQTPGTSTAGGRIVMFTSAMRIDMPTASTRLTPFFTAGGGIASVRRNAEFTYPSQGLASTPGGPTVPPTLGPTTQQTTASSTDLALTLGGGAGIGLTSSLFLDVDLRIFRLMGDDDRNLGRFGVGVRYSF